MMLIFKNLSFFVVIIDRSVVICILCCRRCLLRNLLCLRCSLSLRLRIVRGGGLCRFCGSGVVSPKLGGFYVQVYSPYFELFGFNA